MQIDDDSAMPIVMAPVEALGIIECSWKAIAHNEHGSADLVDNEYAAKIFAADLEDGDFRIVPAKLLAAADAMHEELLRQIEPLMTSTVNPQTDTLRRLAEIAAAFEEQRTPFGVN